LTFKESDDGFSAEPGDISLRAASDELNRVVSKQVDSLHTAGEKWIAGVTALLGLYGVAGIAIGKDSVKGLNSGWKIFAACVAFAGLAAAICSIWFAYKAAYGWPKEVDVSSDAKLLAWYSQWTHRASTVGEMIRSSVIAAMAALFLLAIVTGIIWFGPAADPASPKVLVKYNQDGDTSKPGSACGKLTKATDGMIHVQVVTGDEQKTVKIQPAWTTSLAATDTC